VLYRFGANGKPELAGAENVRFNLSHTKGIAALAITRDRAVGIDEERVRDNVEAINLADRFFSTAEAGWLRSQSASERFSAFFPAGLRKKRWLRDEEQGFSTSLTEFTFVPSFREVQIAIKIHDDQLPKNWSIWQLSFGSQLRATAAVQGTDIIVRCGSWVWPSER
jgi:4'-phosphopantetheinyl transferase